jgi:uncharacterized damage-inducible protein DinB
MFKTLDHFLKSWEFESKATQRILNNLTDESLKQEITTENWTLGRIAWHIVASIHIITSNTNLTFEELIDFIGQKKPNGTLLMFLLQHQNHHRGQMTVLMRQAGLTVPGIYGPSKEEWANFGMIPPKM